MTFKIKSITTICIFITCIIFLCSCSKSNINYYAFSDISECENIENKKHRDAKITTYDSSEDKYLNGLTPDGFYGANYASEQLTFDIFAYEFKDKKTAKNYFENSTERSSDRDVNFLATSGMSQYKLVVLFNENAYVVYTSVKYKEEVNAFLGEIFSTKIVESGNLLYD